MNIFPAQPFDIDSIMAIEHQAFIPQIQEKKRCFEKRLEAFPQGFFILSDASENVVKVHGKALTCGYFCSELWDSFPNENDGEKVFSRRFKLGHNPLDSHSENGMYLYVTSFALLNEYKSKGLGTKFFESSLAAICGANHNIKKIVLLVNDEWKNALKIYEKFGFKEVHRLKDFFPTLTKKTYSDGIVMTSDAENFRNREFAQTGENVWSGIKI